VAALVAMLTPASAIAGTYSWSQPGDFSGANPETKYGQPSWSYYEGGSGSTTRLACTASGCSGGGDSVSVSSGKLVLQAPANGAVTVVWSNPFTSSQSVTITPSFSVSGLLCGAPTVAPTGTTTLAPGANVTLTLSGALLNSCSATGTIGISGSVSAPSTSVTSPTSGSTVTPLQQSFAGTASSGFGISDQVTLRVYSGSSASGTPVETLSTSQSAGTWSMLSNSALANGQYTAQSEQDDLAGDDGFSSPVTFTVAHSPPSVSVTSPGSGETVTALQQTYGGNASSGAGISDQVTVRVYSGSSASGTPVETLSTTASGGVYSVSPGSVLANGQYTVQAEQDDLVGDQGFSAPITFTVVHSPPFVSVTNPTAGATVSTLQQTYAGQATSGFGISDQVTVRVYGGSSASGPPVETLSTIASGGTFSVSSGSVLANGQYTVQAEQDDVIGDQGLSVPITFTIANPPPAVSLDSLGSAPLVVVTPTLTGTGSTRSLDSAQVTVQVYSGTNTSTTPVRTVTASVGAGGRFAAQVDPALPDGQYTAVATQNSSVGLGSSPSVEFRVKATPPALTLDKPSAGVTVNVRRPTFSGRAGDALGDSPTVTVYLYKGSSVSQDPFGSERVSSSGSSWSAQWPRSLPYGQYTVVAVQTDDAGHASRTQPESFAVAPTPKLIGATAGVSHSGGASVPVGCLAGPGQICTGTVLIVTKHAYRATPGGPTGRLEVLFSSVRIPGGRSLVIHRPVGGSVLRILRRFKQVPVIVTVRLSKPVGGPMSATANRVLKVQR
jgi:hypothetical protein